MCAMLAVAPPQPISEAELGRLGDLVEALMTSLQTEGITGSEAERWMEVEPALGAVLDSAIDIVPPVARRLAAAHQRLGWLLRSATAGAEIEDTAIDDLETVLECLLAYAEGIPVGADRSPAQLLGWLAETLGASQAAIAHTVGVSLRTLQRWLQGDARPGPDEAARIRRLARVVNEARFALTPEGVIAWLDRSTPHLDGRTPADLIRSAEAGVDARLDRLTATLRYG
jgi:putative toxin-antitoxin system antitoxin component (TIGR02293 family)